MTATLRWGTNPDAALRLFCLPYAGASARIYRDWAGELPGEVEVCPVELPGRGTRFSEKPATELEPLITDLLATIVPYTDRPFAILGYSYGAFLGFELALHLEHRYEITPRHLFVAAARGAVRPPDLTPAYELDDTEFRRRLHLVDGTPRELLDHEEFMELMLPVLRADFCVADRYVYRPGPLLGAPITAFGGVDDPSVRGASLRAWQECTTARLVDHQIPGGHFFLHSARELFLTKLSMELRRYV